MHPELIRKASQKANVPILMLMYDALCWFELPVSQRKLWNVYQDYVHGIEIPEFFEDYALHVLAGDAERMDIPNIEIRPKRKS